MPDVLTDDERIALIGQNLAATGGANADKTIDATGNWVICGWLRISLTASDEMVERGIPGFAAAFTEAN